jgi:DNA end-binding protein Ku
MPTKKTAQGENGSERSASKVWTGMLKFGLISMPVSLLTAATEERVSFNQIHPKCQGRIKQQLFCPGCDEVVNRNDLLKGYEYEKGQYVIVTEADLTAVEPKSAKTMELSAFVPASQVDPILFESSYYLIPGEDGEKPYALVLQAMRESSLVGVARIVRSGKEHICVIRPYAQGMILHNLYWTNEVRAISFPELPATNDAEVGMAKQLIQMLTAEWDPAQYKDSYREAVMRLIASKREGKELPAASAPSQKAAIIEIASALQQSLAAVKAKKGVA